MLRCGLFIFLCFTEGAFIFAYKSIEALVTPLGHSITREEVTFRVSHMVSVVLMDFKAQGFELDRGNIRRGKPY